MLNGFFTASPHLVLSLLLPMLIAWVVEGGQTKKKIIDRKRVCLDWWVGKWVKGQAVDKNRSLSEIKVISVGVKV